MFSDPPPESILPKGEIKSFFDVSPIELARQITILDHELFAAIEPKECLKCVWSGKQQKELAPNILKMIDQFNRVSNKSILNFIITKIKKILNRIAVVLLLPFYLKKM